MKKTPPGEFGKPRYGLARARPKEDTEVPMVIHQTQGVAARFSPIVVDHSVRTEAYAERIQRNLVTQLGLIVSIPPELRDAIQMISLIDFLDQTDAVTTAFHPECWVACGSEGSEIIQPLMVARLLSLVLNATKSRERVLEVGTASGYQTIVLSKLFNDVYGIEADKHLFNLTRQHLRKYLLSNVRVVNRSASLGLVEAAPYDVIIVNEIDAPCVDSLVNQLSVGGQLFCRVADELVLLRIERLSDVAFQREMIR
jgi:protein-L-isoaspartate(D-aspartate) O-methyltransferase